MKNGSGKQIFDKILDVLTTKVSNPEEIPLATKQLRAGMLLHGSSSDEYYEFASRLAWGSSFSNGELSRQGVVAKAKEHFISDVFEYMIEKTDLKEFVLKRFEGLSSKDYDACIWAMWLMISSRQMFRDLLEVEVEPEKIDVNRWVDAMTEKYEYHFSEEGKRDWQNPEEPEDGETRQI